MNNKKKILFTIYAKSIASHRAEQGFYNICVGDAMPKQDTEHSRDVRFSGAYNLQFYTLYSHRNTGDALKDSYFMNIIQCLHPYQCAGVAIKFRFRLPKMQISSTEWLARFFLVLVYLVFTFVARHTFRLHSCVP